jgi:hypothetical protein
MVGTKEYVADLRASPACATMLRRGVQVQSALYLATLSISPYLLFEGPVPTKRL